MKVTVNPNANIKIEWEGSVAELTLTDDYGLTEEELETILKKTMYRVLGYVTRSFKHELEEAARYKSLFSLED